MIILWSEKDAQFKNNVVSGKTAVDELTTVPRRADENVQSVQYRP
jgi:hypothetical protein